LKKFENTFKNFFTSKINNVTDEKLKDSIKPIKKIFNRHSKIKLFYQDKIKPKLMTFLPIVETVLEITKFVMRILKVACPLAGRIIDILLAICDLLTQSFKHQGDDLDVTMNPDKQDELKELKVEYKYTFEKSFEQTINGLDEKSREKLDSKIKKGYNSHSLLLACIDLIIDYMHAKDTEQPFQVFKEFGKRLKAILAAKIRGSLRRDSDVEKVFGIRKAVPN